VWCGAKCKHTLCLANISKGRCESEREVSKLHNGLRLGIHDPFYRDNSTRGCPRGLMGYQAQEVDGASYQSDANRLSRPSTRRSDSRLRAVLRPCLPAQRGIAALCYLLVPKWPLTSARRTFCLLPRLSSIRLDVT